jgi:poly(3-hydroxybutyrate) depolymerase
MTTHKRAALLWLFSWWLVAALSPPVLEAAALSPGAGRCDVRHGDRTIPVWYWLPEKSRADDPVLIVMHGVKRDAERYRDEWVPHARKYGCVLLAPEFSQAAFPGERYNVGRTSDESGQPLAREAESFSYIEPIFEAMKAATGNRSERYHLYGHSAGAQFVHRFLYFTPEARVERAVAANAGWWTLPEEQVEFPYGLRNSDVDAAALTVMLQRRLVVLLGTADSDPNHVYLRRTPEALAQGPHRFARGQFFYESGRRRAAALGLPFGWRQATAPGVGHSDKDMAEFAVRCLFDPPAITGRDTDRVRILFGGDTSGGESYQEQYAREGQTNVLVEKGYEHGLAQLNRLLAAADYRVINLETPLTARRESPLKTKDYLHYSDPVKVPALFSQYGPTAFSLANNHTLDHGPEGLDDTRAALVAAGIETFGAGENLANAAQPLRQDFRVGDQTVTLAVFGASSIAETTTRNFIFTPQTIARAPPPSTCPRCDGPLRNCDATLPMRRSSSTSCIGEETTRGRAVSKPLRPGHCARPASISSSATAPICCKRSSTTAAVGSSTASATFSSTPAAATRPTKLLRTVCR